MHWIAALLAVLAFGVFIAVHFGVTRKWATLALGLAILVLAWMVQIIIASGKHLTLE